MRKNLGFSRRDFLQHAQVAGVAVIVGGLPTEASHETPALARLRLDQVCADDFAPYLHESFHIQDPNGAQHEVQLIRVVRHRTTGPQMARQSFSLIFQLDGPTPLPHRIYAVNHPQLGSLDLFLGAVGPRTTGTRVEAVFG